MSTWHNELAEDIRNHFAKSWPHDGAPDLLLAIIANRCPHQAQNATTVRLLEEAEKWLDDYAPLELVQAIRAHLAALQQEGAAK